MKVSTNMMLYSEDKIQKLLRQINSSNIDLSEETLIQHCISNLNQNVTSQEQYNINNDDYLTIVQIISYQILIGCYQTNSQNHTVLFYFSLKMLHRIQMIYFKEYNIQKNQNSIKQNSKEQQKSIQDQQQPDRNTIEIEVDILDYINQQIIKLNNILLINQVQQQDLDQLRLQCNYFSTQIEYIVVKQHIQEFDANNQIQLFNCIKQLITILQDNLKTLSTNEFNYLFQQIITILGAKIQKMENNFYLLTNVQIQNIVNSLKLMTIFTKLIKVSFSNLLQILIHIQFCSEIVYSFDFLIKQLSNNCKDDEKQLVSYFTFINTYFINHQNVLVYQQEEQVLQLIFKNKQFLTLTLYYLLTIYNQNKLVQLNNVETLLKLSQKSNLDDYVITYLIEQEILNNDQLLSYIIKFNLIGFLKREEHVIKLLQKLQKQIPDLLLLQNQQFYSILDIFSFNVQFIAQQQDADILLLQIEQTLNTKQPINLKTYTHLIYLIFAIKQEQQQLLQTEHLNHLVQNSYNLDLEQIINVQTYLLVNSQYNLFDQLLINSDIICSLPKDYIIEQLLKNKEYSNNILEKYKEETQLNLLESDFIQLLITTSCLDQKSYILLKEVNIKNAKIFNIKLKQQLEFIFNVFEGNQVTNSDELQYHQMFNIQLDTCDENIKE